MNGLAIRDNNAENSENDSMFDNITEGVIKVKTWLLRETLSYKPTFITIKVTLAIKFV